MTFRRGLTGTAIVLGALAVGCSRERPPLRYPPVVVMSPYRMPGVLVRAASENWWKVPPLTPRYGDPLPVGVTMYCLQGTTRRGRYVRAGIVAADPRFFPLAHFIELYVGRHYLGRYLVDDTGIKIHGPRIDVWTGNCPEARQFGLQRGTAVLVPEPPRAMRAGKGRVKK
ncbi:MAG: 3D domain-containing protein [Gemmatimonadaceae bacterium]